MTTESNGASNSFDVTKYKIKEENQTYTVKLQKDEFDITIKPMTWQGKNELVAICMTFDEKGNSKYLYELFPYGPGKQACKFAGLPKPTGCV